MAQETNSTMKTRELKMNYGGSTPRSILGCGSPLPLSPDSKWSITHAFKSAFHGPPFVIRHSSFALFLMCLLFGQPAFAQNFTIDWFTVSGAGATSTGGVYSVGGISGQP